MRPCLFFIILMSFSACGSFHPLEAESTGFDERAVDGYDPNNLTLNPNRQVAVIDFAAGSGLREDSGAQLRERVAEVIAAMPHVTLVERQDINQVLEQQAINLDEFHKSPGQQAIVGELLQAEYLVTGSLRGSVKRSRGQPLWKSLCQLTTQIFLVFSNKDQNQQPSVSEKDSDSWRLDGRVWVTLEVKDVSSGKIKLQKSVEGESHTFTAHPSKDDNHYALDLAVDKALNNLRPAIQESLPLRCSVIEMRGRMKYARLNAGAEHGLSQGSFMDLYMPVEGDEGKQRWKHIGRCPLIVLEADSSWIEVQEDLRPKMKLGLRAKTIPEENSTTWLEKLKDVFN